MKSYFASVWKDVKRDKYLYLLILPGLLFFLVFFYRPIWGLQMAFREYTLFGGMGDWVGFRYFEEFFASPLFFTLIGNTLTIGVATLLINFPLPIILALMLNELRGTRFKKTVQTATYIPYFISMVVVVGMFRSFFALETGVVNLIIDRIFPGFLAETNGGIFFMNESRWFLPIYLTMHLWQRAGFESIVFIAALSGVDTSLYEACRVDGGGRLRQLWNVTLPSIMPTIIIMFILRIGGLINVGHEAIILMYPMAGDMATIPANAEVINTFVWRVGMVARAPQFSYTAAIGLFNSVVAFILVMTANSISKRVSDTRLW